MKDHEIHYQATLNNVNWEVFLEEVRVPGTYLSVNAEAEFGTAIQNSVIPTKDFESFFALLNSPEIGYTWKYDQGERLYYMENCESIKDFDKLPVLRFQMLSVYLLVEPRDYLSVGEEKRCYLDFYNSTTRDSWLLG